jgi:hypothetical protein
MSSGDFERGYEFFRQWPRDSLLLWARDTETGRNAMAAVGRKLAAPRHIGRPVKAEACPACGHRAWAEI